MCISELLIRRFGMKKKVVVCIVAIMLCTSAVLFAESLLDFTLINETGVEIYSVYISPSNEEDWGEDVLDVDTLPNNKSVDISFDAGEDYPYWDLRIEDENHKYVEFAHLDLSEISELTLKFQKGKPVAEWK